MNMIETENFCIYFGDAEDNLRVDNAYTAEKLSRLQKNLIQKTGKTIKGLFFLKQTHDADVIVLNTGNQPKNFHEQFNQPGDAIITQEKNVGIGVVTADCLPIALYDTKHHAMGIVHAGWRGLSKKIISNTIHKMKATFATKPADLDVYLGPSAGVCCYEVQTDFLQYFPESVFSKNMIETRNGKFYFNQRQSAFVELIENGISATAIHFSKNSCTMCQPGFCSARNQKEHAGRQPTVAILF